MSNMLVSIIIVSAGSKDYLDALTDSINKQTYRNIEVIVIETHCHSEGALDTKCQGRPKNLSFKKRDSSAAFGSLRMTTMFQENGSVPSYAGALNAGIKISRGNFILCLNDDVVLDEKFIQEALKGFEINELIGMVSGKILRPDKKTIDSTGLFLSRYRTTKERGYGAQDRGQFEKEGYVFGVTGAVAFYRKKMLDEIKKIDFFDPRFGYFYEDLDVAWRAQKKGWRGYYVPSAIAYHIRGGTTRSASGINKRFARCYISDKLQIDLIKNRYLTIIKNDTLSGFLLNLPFIIVYEVILWVYILLLRFRVAKRLLEYFLVG